MPTEIERAILAAIAEGRMKPGERLSETQLAEVFDVSRTIVREALMRLEGRHIISVSPRRGWFVITPSTFSPSENQLQPGMSKYLSHVSRAPTHWRDVRDRNFSASNGSYLSRPVTKMPYSFRSEPRRG